MMVTSIWALTDFTVANGGTRSSRFAQWATIPRSHTDLRQHRHPMVPCGAWP